jgi:hypothetical protein
MLQLLGEISLQVSCRSAKSASRSQITVVRVRKLAAPEISTIRRHPGVSQPG